MRIAILEDEPVQAEVLRALAASAGHDSHVFRDGDSVVRERRRESFDLFVLDWEVPGMSGAEVLAWLRANLREHVPVMFVTGRDREEDIVRVLQSPEISQRVSGVGNYVVADTPEEFSAFIRNETAKWARVVKEAGIKVE